VRNLLFRALAEVTWIYFECDSYAHVKSGQRLARAVINYRNDLTNGMLTDLLYLVILVTDCMTEKLETVRFTTKGQVVIPLRLRKQFDIEDGTRAVVQATSEGILVKPMTAALIKRGRGLLKRTGGKPLTEEWAEHKKSERALEERHAGQRAR
jgi:AbrB family looped-hinge helix DNA binding protein